MLIYNNDVIIEAVCDLFYQKWTIFIISCHDHAYIILYFRCNECSDFNRFDKLRNVSFTKKVKINWIIAHQRASYHT